MFPERGEEDRAGTLEPLLFNSNGTESDETMTRSSYFEVNAASIDGLSVFEESKSQSRPKNYQRDSVLEEREIVELNLNSDFELMSESNSETESFDYSNEAIQNCIDKDHLYKKIKRQMYRKCGYRTHPNNYQTIND